MMACVQGVGDNPAGRRQPSWLRAALCTLALLAAAGCTGSAAGERPPRIAVVEEDGAYRVQASFTVLAPEPVAYAVLTDYEHIPRFMPDVRFSRVLERTRDGAIVEQEAVARYLIFSKRIHLVLDIHEEPGVIRFRDRSGRSFASYTGAWTLSADGEGTAVGYELAARPAFDVPPIVLTRLLRRDAGAMIERLRAEIAARTATPPLP